MDRARASAIAHGNQGLLNPIGEASLADAIEVLDMPIGARAIDVGCGRGEALIRVAERWRIKGVGVDLYPPYIKAARASAAARARGVRFEAGDAAAFVRDAGTFDLALCIGSSHALGGGYAEALHELRRLVEPGGKVLLGEGFWRRPPDPEYLAVLGAEPDELTDYAGLIRTGIEAGLTPLYAVAASEREWDRYEWALVLNGELSGDPEVQEWVRRGRDRYLAPGGRDTLGFGLFVFRRD